MQSSDQATSAMNVAEALALIDSIPYSVLEAGQDATLNWVKSYPGVSSRGDLLPSANFFECTLAVVGLIDGNVIAVGKLLKIKRLN